MPTCVSRVTIRGFPSLYDRVRIPTLGGSRRRGEDRKVPSLLLGDQDRRRGMAKARDLRLTVPHRDSALCRRLGGCRAGFLFRLMDWVVSHEATPELTDATAIIF